MTKVVHYYLCMFYEVQQSLSTNIAHIILDRRTRVLIPDAEHGDYAEIFAVSTR